MRLFELIHKTAKHQDMEAAWELIIRLDPMIRHRSTHPVSGKVDDDLKSEMQLALLKKILKFKIDFDQQRDK